MNKKTDAQLQQDVLNELTWDTRVEPTEIGVAVLHGVVTLTGHVSNYAKKVAAAEAAHRVAGAFDVANEIDVKLPGGSERTDAEIAEAVRKVLEWDVFVPDSHIQSTVSRGAVTLTGTVDYTSERTDAGRAVRNLIGVTSLHNQIEIRHDQRKAQELEAAIKSALVRHAERDSDRIQIDVVGNRVTLRGNVHSWVERQAAIGAAWGTRGVDHVIDRLRVEPTTPLRS